ncbi:MAG: GGDEF domain-containing protein, partial [Gemmatimonadales bacterium]
DRRSGFAVGSGLALSLVIHVADAAAPPVMRLGLFYLVPVVLVTWYAGPGWGSVFTVLGGVLRMLTELADPAVSLQIALLNQLWFVMVAAIAMLAFHTLRRNETLLRDLATYDSLTRVLNARSFQERLALEVGRSRRYARPLALLYLDLDDFKTVNDAHGHHTGDAVLRVVADAIRRAVRQPDSVGRMGGDEFAVLMPETDGAVARAAAERLAANVMAVLNGTPRVTASIGLLACAAPGADADTLLRRVDQAMYEAKREGKNRIVQVEL